MEKWKGNIIGGIIILLIGIIIIAYFPAIASELTLKHESLDIEPRSYGVLYFYINAKSGTLIIDVSVSGGDNKVKVTLVYPNAPGEVVLTDNCRYSCHFEVPFTSSGTYQLRFYNEYSLWDVLAGRASSKSVLCTVRISTSAAADPVVQLLTAVLMISGASSIIYGLYQYRKRPSAGNP